MIISRVFETRMTSIQEKLQLKRVPLDTWNIREQLCLASAVVRSGDQNWMSVSRALKTISEPNRPPDWYSQKSCAAQYGALLEHVETPKRKKRNSDGVVETPQESIYKKLTQERVVEIQKNLAEMGLLYDQLLTELIEARDPITSHDRLCEIWMSIETTKMTKERENARRAALLKEREERRARADRNWRPSQPTTPTSPIPSPMQQVPPASPLLTSLLKSSPVVTTPQLMTHPANVVDTVSPSVTAPTLSMLLEKSAVSTCSQHESRNAAIEHIKIQLQEIEHQLNVATTSGVQLPVPPVQEVQPSTPAVDIDDIEIKAEDVYAFRDIDIHIPPVTHMHKGNNRTVEKVPVKKEDHELPPEVIMEAVVPETVQIQEECIEVKEEPLQTPQEVQIILPHDIPLPHEEQEKPPVEKPPVEKPPAEKPPVEKPPAEKPSVEKPPAEKPPVEKPPTPLPIKEVATEAEVRISFPEVKFPTTEIKVIQPEDLKVKEEIKEPEIPSSEPEEKSEEITLNTEVVDVKEEVVELSPKPTETEEIEGVEDIPLPDEPVQPLEEPATVVEKEQTPPVEEMVLPKLEDIPLPPDEPSEPSLMDTKLILEPPRPPLPPSPPESGTVTVAEKTVEPEPEPKKSEKELPEESCADDIGEEKTLDEIKREEDAEDCIPLKQMIKKDLVERPVEETHTETDDDTPMELSREEEKDGKKKRDYSRKKKSESRTWSGSESAAEASAPESPGGAGTSASTTEAERHHRLWRKSVMLVYSRLCAHKYASLFVRPITDEEAPGYSLVVKRPMDLSTIRRNIDNGVIRTTAEFQRDVLLMLSNALMYNSSEHSVYAMAKEMHEEAQCQLGMLLAAQAHAGLGTAPTQRRKRRRPDSHDHQLPHRKRATH